MSGKTIEFLVKDDGLILRTRYWDGIDRPEFEDIAVSLARARQLILELPTLIEVADANAADKRQRHAAELRRKIDAMEAELSALKAQEAREPRHG
jgi:hypothetical protein